MSGISDWLQVASCGVRNVELLGDQLNRPSQWASDGHSAQRRLRPHCGPLAFLAPLRAGHWGLVSTPSWTLSSWQAVAVSTSHCAWSRAGLTSPSKSLLETATKTRLCGLFSKSRPGGIAGAGNKPASPLGPGEEGGGQDTVQFPTSGKNPWYLPSKQHPGEAVCQQGPAQQLPVLAFFTCLLHAKH